jgi:two-component sensor histidine kinase
MGSWDWDWVNGDWMWDEGQYQICGVDPQAFKVTSANVQALLHPDDANKLRKAFARFTKGARAYETEFRIKRPDGEIRWCVGTAATTIDRNGNVVRVSGVTVDITERKRAEERQSLLIREVDHRAKNALALAQSIVRLTRAQDMDAYVRAVEGRISALARIHTILSLSSWQGAEIKRLVDEELAPYAVAGQIKVSGSELQLEPATAQTLALAFHELVTNSAKYGALSAVSGRVSVQWELQDHDTLMLAWEEVGGPEVQKPKSRGFGTRSVIASVESQLGGQALFDWRAEGLVCRLLVPVSSHATAPESGDRVAAPLPPNTGLRMQAGSAAP